MLVVKNNMNSIIINARWRIVIHDFLYVFLTS